MWITCVSLAVERCEQHFGRPKGRAAGPKRRVATRETRLTGTHSTVRKGQGIMGSGEDRTKEPHNTGKEEEVLLL